MHCCGFVAVHCCVLLWFVVSWLFVVRCSLFFCWLFDVGGCLFVASCWLFVVVCRSFVVDRWLLLVVYCVWCVLAVCL